MTEELKYTDWTKDLPPKGANGKFGPKMTFEHADIYSGKRITLGKERVLRHVVLPYQLTRSSRSFIGGKGELDEPGGISIAGDKLYIADTNHHAIKVAELATGKLTTLTLSDPDSLLQPAAAAAL